MKTFLIAAAVLVVAVALMCVFMLRKDGEFPKFDVGSNPEMQKRGIHCFKDEDAKYHTKKAPACDGGLGSDCSDCSFYGGEKK